MMEDKKPNILFFMLDGFQGKIFNDPESPIKTPNFDRIIKNGVNFEKAYTCIPTCSPARASLMTGLLPHNHGVLQVEHCVDDDQSVLRLDKPHWAQNLLKAGYSTGYYGKWHIERTYKLDDFGWQEYCTEKSEEYLKLVKSLDDAEHDGIDQNIMRYQHGPEGYDSLLHYGVTDTPIENRPVTLPAKLGGKFLDTVLENNSPWCCAVSYPAPNEAMYCGRDAYNLYNAESIQLPLNNNDNLNGKPNVYKRTQNFWQDVTEKQWKEARACYYGRVTEIDAEFGKILKQIEDADELDNTIVIVTTDHGKYVGAHGMEAHNFGAFEEIYSIPIFMSGPGIVKGKPSKAKVAIQDVCPTILDLVGAEPIDVPDSKSFAEILRTDKNIDNKFNSLYGEYHGTRFPLMQRVYWEDNWKFVFNGFDFDELYNLETDPDELNNLAEDPKQQERIKHMMGKTWEKIIETKDKALIESHYYSMRMGKFGPNLGICEQ